MRIRVSCALGILLWATVSSAQVPQKLGYQGRLLNADSTPKTGTQTITFRLFDSLTGGTKLWEETQTIALTNGFYETFLGDVSAGGTAITNSNLDGSVRYVEVLVSGDAAPLTPRQPIGAVPYAFRAGVMAAANLIGAVPLANGGTATTNGDLTASNNGIGVTSTDAFVLQNTTTAAAGAQQMSPRVHLIGQGWKTNSTAASQTVDAIMELLPVQGAANPTGTLQFSTQVNGGGYTPNMTLTSAGLLTATTFSGSGASLTNLPASSVTGTLPIGNGGTGATTLTTHGVLLGEGTSAIAATAAGGSAKLLLGQGSSADPTWNTMSGDASISSSGLVTVAGLQGVTVSATGPASNQVLSYNGSQWVPAAVSNAMLSNSSVTVTAGTGMSGGGSVSLGSSITLNNTGVLTVGASGVLSSSGGANPSLSLSGTVPIANGGTGTTNGDLTASNNGIGTTSTDAFVLQNTTSASAGAQQISPRLHFSGQGWKTNATAASQAVDAIMELVPVQGAANPSGTLKISTSVNGAGYAQQMSLDTSGTLTATTFSGSGASLTGVPTTAITGTLPIGNGGIGVTSLTAHGVVLGEGASALSVTAAGGSGRLLLGQGSSADPTWNIMSGDASISSSGLVTVAGLQGVTVSATGPATNQVLSYNGSQWVPAAVSNAMLSNSSVTVTAGTGMSGGGSVSLGNSITLNNTGVLTVGASGVMASSGGANPSISLSGTVPIANGGTGTTNGDLTASNNGIGATSTDAFVLQNTTSAAAGAQQISPRLHFSGQGWKTNATAASQAVDAIMEFVPVQGAANPTGTLKISTSVNGAAYAQQMSLDTSGTLTATTFSGSGASLTSLPASQLTGTAAVGVGGTGATTLTAHGVLLGEGTGAVTPTAAGASGNLLLGQGSSADPTWNAMSGDATLSSSGALTLANTAVTAAAYTNASITVDAKGRLTAASSGTAPVTSVGASSPLASSGGTTPTISLSGTVVVGNGGTGATTFTAHGILLGEGTGAVTPTAAGAAGKLLIAQGSSADPTWNAMSGDVTITSAGVATVGALQTIAVSASAPTTNQVLTYTGSQWAPTSPAAVAGVNGICNGRLTVTSGTAVTTSDVTGASANTLYFTPWFGNQIGLYYSSSWGLYSFSEISKALSAATDGGAGLSANKNYDVYAYYTGAAVAIDPAFVVWTSDTAAPTRGTQDGITVKNGDSTRRLIGVIRTTATATQTEDSAAKRYVLNWHRANRVYKSLESTDSVYNSTTSTTFVQCGSVQVSYLGAGDGIVDMQGSTVMEDTITGANTGILTIGSSGTVKVSAATTGSIYQGTGYDIDVIATLREAQTGLVTRYLIFRSTLGYTVACRGDSSGNSGDTPSTVLKAMVQM